MPIYIVYMLKRPILLSLLSTILLSLSWHAPFSGLILLVAWLPLLLLEDDFYTTGRRGCWKYYTLTIVLWNIITTYWIYKATLFGAVGAVIGNSAQMILIFALFRWVKKRTNRAVGYTFLVALWLAWEYFYFDAEISWPWLVLGNGFSKDVRLIQWYEYTGVLGGSLWVWLVNLSLFAYLKYIITNYELRITKLVTRRSLLVTLLLFILIFAPIAISLVQFYNYEEKENPCNVVLLQPNIDPYNDKFGGMSDEQQLDILLALAQKNVDTTINYVVGPETALNGVNEQRMLYRDDIRRICNFVSQYPHLSMIIGATSHSYFYTEERPTPTARKMEGGFYDVYNTALQITNENDIQIYHKSKLVIGAEKTPYPEYFRFLEDHFIDLGGAIGAFGVDEERKIFTHTNSSFRAGVAICYEAIYGRFYTEYVQRGANLMFIISNDGWWGNTAGYKQLLHQSSMRAIETRRSIARSANTGISAFINQRGEIVSQTGWWKAITLKGCINANDDITFYVRYGDFIGRIAVFLWILLLLYALIPPRLRRV